MRSPHPLHLLLPGLLVACSGESLNTAKDSADTGSWYDDGDDGGGAGGDGGWNGGDTGGDGYDPEEEDSFFKLRPASTAAYVFVANPDRDTVTRVSVPGLEVITAEVGSRPTQVATTPDYSRAVTFNQGSDSVTIVDAETLATVEVGVRPDFNNMAMSPDGRWVMCWHDPAAEDEDDVDEGGATSYNEVSFVDTVAGTHVPLVVGFHPRGVEFTDDGSRAVVVSDAYVAVIDLTAEDLAPTRIAVADDLIDPPTAEEVLLDPAGHYAIVRQFGADDLALVDLDLAAVDRIPSGLNPTDLDLTPDGARAVVVARGSNELWIYDLADPFAAAEVVTLPEGEVFGSVVMSPDGTRGLLYSTATGAARYASWEVETGEVTLRSLVKPVKSMGISPTGGTALVFHPDTNGEDVDPDSEFYDEFALTMVDLTDDFFSNPLLLPAEPTGYAHSQDGTQGFFVMEDQPWLEVLHYESLLYDEVRLKSNPVHVGVLPESTLAWVSQEHELGRISFYDPATTVLQTITGFELNSGIEH